MSNTFSMSDSFLTNYAKTYAIGAFGLFKFSSGLYYFLAATSFIKFLCLSKIFKISL